MSNRRVVGGLESWNCNSALRPHAAEEALLPDKNLKYPTRFFKYSVSIILIYIINISLSENSIYKKTIINLLHEDVPEKSVNSISDGWDAYYLGAMKEMFEEVK